MANEIETKIAQFAKVEKARVAAWFNSNWMTLLVGAVIGGLIVEVLHKL